MGVLGNAAVKKNFENGPIISKDSHKMTVIR